MKHSGKIYGKTGYQLADICIDNIRYGCYAEHYLSSLDLYGNVDDIISYDMGPNCCMAEHINCAESLKQCINTTFLHHLAITRKAFQYNYEILELLGFYRLINTCFSRWIDRLKFFYLAILSNTSIFERVSKHGITLKEIETSLERLFHLDENYRKIKGSGQN